MARAPLERNFQGELVKELRERYPEGYVYKLDGKQGFPDLLILWKNRWATLECKRSAKAARQPNQAYYVDRMNSMSFSRFIFPENRDAVLHELDNFLNGG